MTALQIYTSPQGRDLILEHYARMLGRWPVAAEQRRVSTVLGRWGRRGAMTIALGSDPRSTQARDAELGRLAH